MVPTLEGSEEIYYKWHDARNIPQEEDICWGSLIIFGELYQKYVSKFIIQFHSNN